MQLLKLCIAVRPYKVLNGKGIRKVTLLALFIHIFSAFVLAQPSIVKVGTGEYFTSYLKKNGQIYVTYWSGDKYVCRAMTLRNIMDVDGAAKTNIALDSAGSVYILAYSRATGFPHARQVKVDSKGNAFNLNSKVFGWFDTYLTLRNGFIWYWGKDLLNINFGRDVPAPVQLVSPGTRKIIDLVPLSMDGYTLLALASDGTVWKYVKESQVPVQVKLKEPAVKIAGVGAAAMVIETANDLLALGYLASYLGLKDLQSTPVSIKSQWTAVGCRFPTKQLIGNYNTLHIIDADDNLFGAGENVQGEVGNGHACPDWINYKPNPYAWNWSHGQLLSKPVQIPGKFKNLCTNNSFVFYFFVQDMQDHWYSWGRNKGRCLGNGITLIPDLESQYPNALDVPSPKSVSPIEVKWRVLSEFDPRLRRSPISNAGVNQVVDRKNTLLNGSLSSQQNGKIIRFLWTKVSGNECFITDPNNVKTTVSGLTKGTYIFKLTVTNNFEKSSTSSISVTVR